MKTHPWRQIRDRLKADPKRWERIEAGKQAWRAVHELAVVRERQEMTPSIDPAPKASSSKSPKPGSAREP